MKIDKKLKDNKKELLSYFRNRADEVISEIQLTYGQTQYREQATAVNKALVETKQNLVAIVLQEAQKKKWNNTEKLECILMITYCNYIAMLETRNQVWPYDYMTFSRRIGELWEPFCKLCFTYPINDLELIIPPLFSEVKAILASEIEVYIDKLKISIEEKDQLKDYYNKVWTLVTSGEIKLECDLHFTFKDEKYIVDFKSGFGSNEKGNTNRLLLVGSIYKNLGEDHKCLLFVRSAENNAYFQTLKRSGVWEAFSGDNTYDEILKYSGFDIKSWIKKNVKWEIDFKAATMAHLKKHSLELYLLW